MGKKKIEDGYEGLEKEELIALLRKRDEDGRKKDRIIEKLTAALAALRAKNAAANERLALANYAEYVGKSDRAGDSGRKRPAKGGPRGRKRDKPLPSREDLERIWESQGRQTVTLDPDPLPEGAVRFGGSESFKVERVPGFYLVRKVLRPKYRAGGSVLQAPADPADPFPHSPATASLAASIITLKYLLGVPVDRQAKRMPPVPGLSSAQALGGVLSRAAALLAPAKAGIEAAMRSSDSPENIDETPLNVLSKHAGGGKLGYVFAAVRNVGGRPVASFRYAPSREAEKPLADLFGESGTIVADGFSGYSKAKEASGGSMSVQRCLAHSRRRWVDCLKCVPADQRPGHPAAAIIERIDALYAAESSFSGDDAGRLAMRRSEDYGANVAALRSLVAALDPDEGTVMWRAKQYFENGGEDFFTFMSDGAVPLDNNRAERLCKAFALARRNFLFVENDAGGEAAATLMTFVENAILFGLDVEAYLSWALSHAAASDPKDILPWSPKVPASCRLRKAVKNI